MPSDTKNQKIKASRLATNERRKSQICKTFEVKIDFSRTNKAQKAYLNNIFLEAKWFYNDILRTNNVFEYDYKTVDVLRKSKNGEFLPQKLKFLTSSLRQSILDRTKGSINSLSTKKKKGKKVGKLKFKSEYNSIIYKQYDNTHWIVNNKSIKLQGLKKPLFVRGLKQLPQNCEFANFNLIRRASGFYIHITTYSNKVEEENKLSSKKDSVGLDFGIKTMITTSDAKTYDVSISESPKLKFYSRKVNKAKKGSKNRYKLRRKLRLECEAALSKT